MSPRQTDRQTDGLKLHKFTIHGPSLYLILYRYIYSTVILCCFFLQQLQPATDRQGDSGSLLTTVISLGLKYGPTLFNLAFGGEGGSSVPDKSTDKIDELEIKVSQFVFFFLPLFAFFSSLFSFQKHCFFSSNRRKIH